MLLFPFMHKKKEYKSIIPLAIPSWNNDKNLQGIEELNEMCFMKIFTL